ncbi:MAG: hypothetical protein AB1Z98_23750 [Nannocystaceae bacterium]
MPTDLVSLVARWTRSTNRRVLTEEALRGVAWLVIIGIAALGLHRLPDLLLRIRIAWPEWMPSPPSMAAAAYVLGATAATVVVVRSVLRVRRRRIDVLGMARRIDEQQGTEDLVATALAVEAGTVAGSTEVQDVVRGKAQTAVASVRKPLPSFRTPGRVLLGAGVLTGAALAMPLVLEEIAALTIPAAEAAQQGKDDGEGEPALPLDEQTKARVDEAIEQLQRYERNPALRRDAREQLAAAREHLQRALDDPEQATRSLSRAEQALRELAKQAKREGLFDQQQLEQMSNDELTQSMNQAMEQGQNDTAAELGKELSKRMENASESELRRMSEGFRKHFPPTTTPRRDPDETKPGEGEGERESAEERRERWKQALEDMAKDMERGESGMSSSEMRRLAEELAAEADRGNGSLGRELDETLGEVRGARRRHLDELGRKREGEGPGDNPGEGKEPGEGEGKGPSEGKGAGEGKGEQEGKGADGSAPPSGKPGPGGGRGERRYGFLPPGSIAPGERVDVPSGGPPKGAVRIIERAAQGPGRQTEEYRDIHHEYSAVAEAAVRREEIPLTRRDYIRDYFQAVRPR